jgi:hypothetical protein
LSYKWSSNMVRLSFTAHVLLFIAPWTVEYASAFGIKSKTASGTGCPDNRQVTTKVWEDYGRIDIHYPELGPDTTGRGTSKSCQVDIEIEGFPAGSKYTLMEVDHSAKFYGSGTSWEQKFVTEAEIHGNSSVATVGHSSRPSSPVAC